MQSGLPTPNRRTVLTAIGVGLVAGCSAADTSARRPEPPTVEASGRATGSAPSCVLTPEGSEGPFYVDTDLVRRDIREGRPGVQVELRITVVDATSCRPLQDAAVDIWHADALGVYSGVQGDDGSRFLRGIQRTDPSGVAAFTTIFPGWYDNRSVHIHVKVHIGGAEIHTGQLYLADEVTAAVAAVTPYAERTVPRTHNDDDFLFRRGGSQSLLAVTGQPSSGYQTDITIGVKT